MNSLSHSVPFLRKGWLSILSLALISVLSACGGGGGGGGPAPDAVPTGYYQNNGTARVLADDNTTPIDITDLQGMIHNGRLIMLSAAQGLSYDGAITVSGNTYVGTLTAYRNGTKLTTAPVTGTITQGVSVTGTLSGAGANNGSFALNYAATNSEVAALGRVQNMINPYWQGPIGGSTSNYGLQINGGGSLLHDRPVFSGTFDGCNIYGTITPIAATNLYTVTVVFDATACINSNIIAANNYTGFATTRQRVAADDTLVLMVTNGSYSLATDFIR